MKQGIRYLKYRTVVVRPSVGGLVVVNSKALYNLMPAFIGQGDFLGAAAVIFLQLPPSDSDDRDRRPPFSSVRLAHKF